MRWRRNLPAACVDPNQLEVALLNLAVNARDAMPEGGAISISAKSADVGSGALGLAEGGSMSACPSQMTGPGCRRKR